MMLGGKTVFPITLGNGPPFEATCPDNGLKGWTEVARAGVKMLLSDEELPEEGKNYRKKELISHRAPIGAAEEQERHQAATDAGRTFLSAPGRI